MRNLSKLSKLRVIKTGYIYEIYNYEIPYAYNMGCRPKTAGSEEIEKIPRERQDTLLRSQTKIRRLINANAFVYGCMPIFVTYTFAKNITDVKQANKCFTEHIVKLKRKHFEHLRYVAVPELQKRGAVHYHVIYFDLPYIPNIKKIFEYNWQHGFLQIKAVKKINNIGAYISKYFTKDWELKREKGQKAYFTSLKLFQPELYRSLDKVPDCDTMTKECTKEFISERYGKIIYQQYKIKQI